MTRQSFRPCVDRLDPRCLLAASITAIDLGVQGQILNIQGSGSPDLIVITDQAVLVNGQARTIEPDVIGIYADANGGNDLIVNLGSRPVILHGGTGNDLILSVPTSNPAYINVLYGDSGTNRILADPTQSAVFEEALNFLTVDTIGPVAFFHDASDESTSLSVFTDPDGTTHVVEPAGETLLPPGFTVGLFDLGPGDDAFFDSSPTFRTLVYGGLGHDDLHGDRNFPS